MEVFPGQGVFLPGRQVDTGQFKNGEVLNLPFRIVTKRPQGSADSVVRISEPSSLRRNL